MDDKMKTVFTRNDKLLLDPETGRLSMSDGSDVSAYLEACPGVAMAETGLRGLVPVNLMTQPEFTMLERQYLHYKALAEFQICA